MRRVQGWQLTVLVVLTGLMVACASSNRPLQLVGGSGPVYPAEARAQGIEGIVEVQYDVSTDGRVENAKVVRSDPPGVFDEAALAAVRSWRFNAPVIEGEPQRARNRISTVQFRLSGADVYDDK